MARRVPPTRVEKVHVVYACQDDTKAASEKFSRKSTNYACGNAITIIIAQLCVSHAGLETLRDAVTEEFLLSCVNRAFSVNSAQEGNVTKLDRIGRRPSHGRPAGRSLSTCEILPFHANSETIE